MRKLATTAILLVVAATPSLAKTWIIDANNGPGTDFTELPQAVSAAATGDTIVVRAGDYQPFTTSKGLRLLGQSGATLVDQVGGFPPMSTQLSLANLPAGTEFVLKGFSFNWAIGSQAAIAISNCQGRVVIDRLAIQANSFNFAGNTIAAVEVSNSPQVSFTQCTLRGTTGFNLNAGPALRATMSTVVTTGCDIAGGHAAFIGHGTIGSGAGMELDNAKLILSGGSVRGGNGDNGFGLGGSSPAIAATNSDLLLTGDALTMIRAGDANNGPEHAAIEATGGTVTHDPNVQILSGNSQPAIVGTATVTVQREPSLLANGAPLGGTIQATLFSPQGEFAGLYFSLPANPVSVPGMGDLYLNLNQLFALAFGVQDGTEHWTNLISVPVINEIRGLAIALQCTSGPIPGIIRLSTPALVILD